MTQRPRAGDLASSAAPVVAQPRLPASIQQSALIAIVLLAALFRLPYLADVPHGLFLDEASRGYDAYSLLKTGADQYGARWPLFAEGLDDYTPTLYTVLVIPFVALLGLNEVAVRLPAALAGIATVGTAFLCGRALLGPTAGLVGAALVAISPWHILPSRTGAEWILLPLFVTAGIWLLARGRQHGPSLLLAGIVLGVGLYSYAFARLLVPLLVAGFGVLWWRDLLKHWRWALAGALILVVCATPLVMFGLTPAGQARLQTVVPLDKYRGLALVPYALGNFASYFGPGFLLQGTEPAFHHHLAGYGPLLWMMAPLVLVGLFAAIRKPTRSVLFVFWWIVAAPASAALHRESPSSALLLGAIGSWHLLAGLGAAELLSWTRSLRWARIGITLGLLACLSLTSVAVAWSLYVEFPIYGGADWLSDSRDAIRQLEARRADYDGVLVSDRLLTPHILVLFFTQADPATYQPNAIHVRQPNVRSRGKVGAYEFGRTADLLERPGRYLVWLPADEARTVFKDRLPLLNVHLPGQREIVSQRVYETERR